MKNAKTTILAIGIIALGTVGSVTPSDAGRGASPLGQDPDFVFTLAEREQWQRLRRERKIKSIYSSDHNRGLAIEADRFFDERERRKKHRKRYR